jgi:hypothetical protein
MKSLRVLELSSSHTVLFHELSYIEGISLEELTGMRR